jgi:hypothetical protein
MTKKEAIKIVLEELKQRLPKDKTKGFMPTQEVIKAMEILEQ